MLLKTFLNFVKSPAACFLYSKSVILTVVCYLVVFLSFAVCSFAACSSDGGVCSFYGVFCSVSGGASVFFLRPISFSSLGKSGV